MPNSQIGLSRPPRLFRSARNLGNFVGLPNVFAVVEVSVSVSRAFSPLTRRRHLSRSSLSGGGPGRTRVRCEVESTCRTTEPTALTTMALLYSGHLNNLFRFLITEARSGSPREDANAAEALALLDCRFYHMLRTYDTHCRE